MRVEMFRRNASTCSSGTVFWKAIEEEAVGLSVQRSGPQETSAMRNQQLSALAMLLNRRN